MRRNTESLTLTKPSRLSQSVARVKAVFTREFWSDMMEHTDAETLVDGKLLSYAYLEAGVIEMLGS